MDEIADYEVTKDNLREMGARGLQPAQQKWVTGLSIMMQSVLFAAVRAPDGIKKDHPVKVIMRWYRRCILISAFDGKPILDPFTDGGGSFTGPFTRAHAVSLGIVSQGHLARDNELFLPPELGVAWSIFDCTRDVYLRHVDELPHHFQLHLMHAAEIVGYYHPNREIAEWWRTFYMMIVNDAHLYPEPPEHLNLRLSDNPDEWRKREVVTVK